MLRVAFTGTRNGMTRQQRERFLEWLQENIPDEFHQGCCVGADEQATVMVDNEREYFGGCIIIGHPGKSYGGKGSSELVSQVAIRLCSQVWEPEGHFSRNRAMVGLGDMLVATPWQEKEQEPSEGSGGGTWYTIQFAVKQRKPVTIIWPDGEVEVR